jgi:hypothetical protein
METPLGGPTSSGMFTLHCPPKRVHALATLLRDKGAEQGSWLRTSATFFPAPIRFTQSSQRGSHRLGSPDAANGPEHR